MEHIDPGVSEQEDETDVEAHEVIDSSGHPAEELQMHELMEGVEFDQLPEESHKEGHPTPNHPTGRLV